MSQPEKPHPLRGLQYGKLRDSLNLTQKDSEETTPSPEPEEEERETNQEQDEDWVQTGFIARKPPLKTLSDPSAFERHLHSKEPPPIAELRSAIVKRCQKSRADDIQRSRACVKRHLVEDGLRELAAQQIASAEQMLLEMCE